MKKFVTTTLCAFIALASFAQVYQFTDVKVNKATPVKNQASTGTCWCFAATSFIESELIRMGKGEYDLSEMFTVRHNYDERINDNFLRRGKGNIGPGSISHMALKRIQEFGIVPEEVYTGINYDSPKHNHGELGKYLKAIVGASVELKKRSPEYYELQESLFDIYLGKLPEKFTFQGKEYTPITFRDFLGLDMSDYVEITSLSHHPFYQRVPLEIPDNWDHETLYNLPLDEFMSVIDNAINNGYTVAWDGDCSEKGYVFAMGISIVPQDTKLTRDEIMKATEIIPELEVNQANRQEMFESFTTTDDHLEHIIGITKDQKGTKYYITKNSWGTERNPMKGYHNMSENYVKGKTISIVVHKNALPKDIKKKLGIK
jgi:aminopeptidase C